MANFVNLKHGVSKDWPAALVNDHALKTSDGLAYIDQYTRENLAKTQMKQRKDHSVDLIPIDLSNTHQVSSA